MKLSLLTVASALSDEDLLARLLALAGQERQVSVELVAHLAALDTRPSVFAAQGFSSLFSYCTQGLGLSEDAACNRIDAARAARRFPLILDLLASGALTLTAVRLLAKHLTPPNHQAVLAKASRRGRRELEALVAELAPRPDVPTSVRKLPASMAPPAVPAPLAVLPAFPLTPPSTMSGAPAAVATPAAAAGPPARPIVQATSPARYRVQFTIGQESHDRLRRLQDLRRREIPDGDPAEIFDRAVTVLLEKVEGTKLEAATKPRSAPAIRRRTDNADKRPHESRHIPRSVRRAVTQRDGGQCAFVASLGRRCTERSFLEYHHVHPYALAGPATVENISLRCRRHNAYEAELVFGPNTFARLTTAGASAGQLLLQPGLGEP